MGSDADFAVCTAIVSKVKTTNDLRIYQHVSEYLVKFKKKRSERVTFDWMWRPLSFVVLVL